MLEIVLTCTFAWYKNILNAYVKDMGRQDMKTTFNESNENCLISLMEKAVDGYDAKLQIMNAELGSFVGDKCSVSVTKKGSIKDCDKQAFFVEISTCYGMEKTTDRITVTDNNDGSYTLKNEGCAFVCADSCSVESFSQIEEMLSKYFDTEHRNLVPEVEKNFIGSFDRLSGKSSLQMKSEI